jgi:hypothetical protein
MNDRQRLRLAQAVATRADGMARALDCVTAGTTVMGRIRDAQGGIRAKAWDTNGGSARHDATFAGAMMGDQAVHDEHALDAALKAAAVALGKAWEIVGRYPPPHRATDADLLALGRANGSAEPCCQSCSRIVSPAGGPRWEPPRPGMAQPTFVGGRLEEPKLLCEWCYQCVRRWGRLPSVTELERHHRGEIVPWPADVRRPT